MNAGSIAGSVPNRYDSGVDLAAGGSVTNQSGGVISGYAGISGYAAAVTVVNAGIIASDASYLPGMGTGMGVRLRADGSVTNESGGTISGYQGIFDSGAALTVVNAGRIVGGSFGIYSSAGGSVTNQSGGTISGYEGINALDGAATVVNAGNITGNTSESAGVNFGVGGSVTNQSGGVISGFYGIYSYGGGHGFGAAMTVVNAGTIIGGRDAVKFGAGYANRLVIDPNAVFSGTVTGGNTIGGEPSQHA